jgi:hypothetical protein
VDLQNFTQNLMQTRCPILPSIADKMNHEVKKSTHVKTTRVHSTCHMADWWNRFEEVWPWPPFSSSFTEAVATISLRTFRYTFSAQCGLNIFL